MKQKKQLIALLLLAVIAVVVWSGAWKVSSPIQDPISFLASYKPLPVVDTSVNWDKIKRAQQTEYKSTGHNPFTTNAVLTSIGQGPNQVKTAQDRSYGVDSEPRWVPPEQPKPAVLPASIKYFGYGTVPVGSPRRAFFSDGENNSVYVVAEGDILLGRYRITKVGNSNVEFQDTSSGQRGSAPLEEQANGPQV